MPEETAEDGQAIHRGEPATDRDSKLVMLTAASDDTVEVAGHGEFTVVTRKEPYYGPDVRLWDEDEEHQYRLVAPGFAADLELWRAVVEENNLIDGWDLVTETTAEIVDVAPATQCECGEVLTTLREKRSAMVAGVCPHA